MFRWPGMLAAAVLALAPLTLAGATPEERAFEEKLAGVVPSDIQFAWQRKHEAYGFVHFGPNTFSGREWGTGTESPAVFNPTALDARQWAKAMKSAGMTMGILTVKHHDGFCLWPSRYTGQSVKESPWKDGKGDVFREFSDAMRAEGLDVGVYLSPADLFQIENAAGYYGDGSAYIESTIPTDPATFKTDPTKARQIAAGSPTFQFKSDSYNRYFLNQLYELLTEYGPIQEVWLDGATPKSKGGQQYAYASWYEVIRKLQPKAVIFGKGPDVRWVGNESGTARETEWSVVGLNKPAAEFAWPDMTARILGDRDTLRKAAALHWYPAEADVSICPGWFYKEARNEGVKSADKLMELYENSVGRNATFLLNVPPDKRGLFTDAEVAALKDFGDKRRALYGKNLAAGAKIVASGALPDRPASAIVDGDYDTYWEPGPADAASTLEVTLPQPATFTRIVLQEQIQRGQRVEVFTIEVETNPGEWRRLTSGTTIGYKRILAIPKTTATRLRIRFDSVRVAPTLAEFGLY